jgi:hypothetical protein
MDNVFHTFDLIMHNSFKKMPSFKSYEFYMLS